MMIFITTSFSDKAVVVSNLQYCAAGSFHILVISERINGYDLHITVTEAFD